MKRIQFVVIAILFALPAGVSHMHAQGMAFTYQGRLNDGANPANGSYDLTFALFTSSNGVGQVGLTQTNFAIAVSNGLFTALLDFGGTVFNGTAYWLEIGVRPASGGAFMTLAPRQPVTPTPYALFAPTAGTVPNGAITAAKLASGAAAANLQAGGQSAVAGGGVVLSEQADAAELINAGYQKIGRVNLIDEAWLARAPGPAGLPARLARRGHSAVWTGTEMLVWGGVGGTIVSQFALSTGGRYNPTANTWAALPTLNAPGPRTGHRAVWTGDDMLVWGGTDLTAELNTGGRYSRAANAWSAITTNNAPSPRKEHTAVWDGTRMIVWGGSVGAGFLRDGGIYNPLTDGWLDTLISTNAPPARALHAAVWTGTEMVVHGGYNSTTYLDDTWHYTPPRIMFLYLKP